MRVHCVPMRTRPTLIGIALFSILVAACNNQEPLVINEPAARNAEENSVASSIDTVSSIPNTEVILTSSPSVPSEKPASVRIQMPFASQAPGGNWDDPYQEACEEASLLLVHHYLTKEPLDNAIMDRSILDLVAWETEQGYPQDVTIAQLADITRDKFGYSAEVIEGGDVTIERIEEELAQGNPVITPLQGQDIGNPYFSGDGPPYHMLVIIGYNDSQFITHDVGTRHGANYAYKKEVIMNAIHDWTGSKETVRSGPRKILIVRK